MLLVYKFVLDINRIDMVNNLSSDLRKLMLYTNG